MRTLLACMLAAGLCSLYAADPTGTIAGTVTDPSGAVIAGAKVKATAGSTGLTRSTTTGVDGGYLLPLMPGRELHDCRRPVGIQALRTARR